MTGPRDGKGADPSRPPVTRGALERVLARAAALQSASGDEGDASDALSESQVLDLGREVGLSPEYLRQALAEERARISPDTSVDAGLAFRMFGPSSVTAQRIVRGAPARVLDTLDRWMQRDEWMRVVRQRADLRVWEPRRGFLPSLRRAFTSRDYALFRANDISATVVPVESATSLVRLEADFSELRRSAGKHLAAGAVLGSAGTTAAIIGSFMLPVAVLPAILVTAGTYVQARTTQQHATQRALLTLQLLLDRLERGDAEPPSLLRMIETALPPTSRP